MKNLTRALLFLPIFILLTSCPYETKVPISEADNPVDTKLLGKWYKDGEVDKEYTGEYYNIVKDNDNSYKIIKMELNSEDSTYKEEVYISHISNLKGSTDKSYKFLNMKKDGTYYLHKIDLIDDRFVLSEVTDNIDEKFNTNEIMRRINSFKDERTLSFRQFIKNNTGFNSSLFFSKINL